MGRSTYCHSEGQSEIDILEDVGGGKLSFGNVNHSIPEVAKLMKDHHLLGCKDLTLFK
jgi:hypothetical protein